MGTQLNAAGRLRAAKGDLLIRTKAFLMGDLGFDETPFSKFRFTSVSNRVVSRMTPVAIANQALKLLIKAYGSPKKHQDEWYTYYKWYLSPGSPFAEIVLWGNLKTGFQLHLNPKKTPLPAQSY